MSHFGTVAAALAALTLSAPAESQAPAAVAASVTDLSRDGCRIESEETLKIGDVVTVNAAPLGYVEGTVRWSLFGTAGVRFVRED